MFKPSRLGNRGRLSFNSGACPGRPERRPAPPGIEDGWFSPVRELGPLHLELAVHNPGDRCQDVARRPLAAATKQEHFDNHVGQVWAGIFHHEQDRRQPSLYVRDGKLVYLNSGDHGDHEITEHTGESIATLAASAVFWYLDCQARVIAT